MRPAICLAALLAGCYSRSAERQYPSAELSLTEQISGTTALLQAVSAVDDQVVWVSGHRATWARSTDGGATWQSGAMTGPDSVLQFRDVHAVSADVAYLLAAGPGARSRIYRTTNGGRSWQLQFRATDSTAFFDCFDFWSPTSGVAVGDATGGRMDILVTTDGATWQAVPDARIPAALENEGAFAASGTCLRVTSSGRALIGTGAPSGARVYRTSDFGATWTVASTPIEAGNAAGIATLAFRDPGNGLALGGRIGQPDSFSVNVAVTRDGGATWAAAPSPPFPGAVYGASFMPGSRTLVAVSPKGMVSTADDARTWTTLSSNAYWAVAFTRGGVGWAVGPQGRITKIEGR